VRSVCCVRCNRLCKIFLVYICSSTINLAHATGMSDLEHRVFRSTIQLIEAVMRVIITFSFTFQFCYPSGVSVVGANTWFVSM